MWSRRNKGWAAAIAFAGLTLVALGLSAVLYSVAESRQSKLRADAADERVRLQERESLIHAVQRTQFVETRDGWSDQAWSLIRQASEIRRDERLRDLAAATLLGIDARIVKHFPVAGSSVAFDASGKRLLIGGLDDVLGKPPRPTMIWDGDRRDESVAASGPVAFDTEETPLQLSLRNGGRQLTLWNLTTRQPLREFDLPEGDPEAAVALSPRGNIVAVSHKAAGRTWVWNAVSGERIAEWTASGDVILFSDDADLIALADPIGRNVRVWSTSTKRLLMTLPTGNLPTRGLAFGVNPRRPLKMDADGPRRCLAIGDAGGTIAIWDLASQKLVAYCRGSSRDIFALAFSPDGTLLASGGRQEVRLWDTASGRQRLHLRDRHGMDYINSIAFRPDGQRLAITTLGAGNAFAPGVSVWDIVSGRGQQRLPGLSGQIELIAISPDGRRVAALAQNWEIGLWNLEARRLQAIIEVTPGEYADNAGLVFSPDGKHLAFSCGSLEATEVRLWDADTSREVRRWRLPPGLQNKLGFDGPDRLWHAQVELRDGKSLPLSNFPWREHPRVCRIRDLKGADPTRIVTEIADFNRHVFLAQAAPNGRHLAIEGLGGANGESRWLKMFEMANGKATWSFDSRQTNAAAMFIFEPSSKVLHLASASGPGSLLVSAPDGRTLTEWRHVPNAVSDGSVYAVATALASSNGCFVHRQGNSVPVVNLAVDTPILGIAIDRSGTRLAWGERDGSVVVTNLAEVRAKLNGVGLGW